jgi:hypothetical protein
LSAWWNAREAESPALAPATLAGLGDKLKVHPRKDGMPSSSPMRVGRSAALGPNLHQAQCPVCKSGTGRPASLGSELLLKKNLHCLKVKGYRIGPEEIVADHASKVEAKRVFPRERPIVETRDVVFL